MAQVPRQFQGSVDWLAVSFGLRQVLAQKRGGKNAEATFLFIIRARVSRLNIMMPQIMRRKFKV